MKPNYIYLANISNIGWVAILIFAAIILYAVYSKYGHSSIKKRHKNVPLVHYYEAEYLEQEVYKLLLNESGYYLNCINILLDNSKYPTQIDNLLITNKAIFCIECKDYRGIISIYEYGQNWYQYLDKNYEFYNPIKQNNSHITFLKNNLQMIDKLPIISLVVFSDKCTFKKYKITGDHVHVVHFSDLKNYITAYDKILKPKINGEKLMNIENQLIRLDNFSVDKVNEHIDRINRKKK